MYEIEFTLIQQMLETVTRIFEYTKEFRNAEEFEEDCKTVDATLMNFVVLGETAGKINNEFREKYKNIAWRKIYAFRNIVAHDYFGVDEEEVWDIVTKHLPKLKFDLEKILNN